MNVTANLIQKVPKPEVLYLFMRCLNSYLWNTGLLGEIVGIKQCERIVSRRLFLSAAVAAGAGIYTFPVQLFSSTPQYS